MRVFFLNSIFLSMLGFTSIFSVADINSTVYSTVQAVVSSPAAKSILTYVSGSATPVLQSAISSGSSVINAIASNGSSVINAIASNGSSVINAITSNGSSVINAIASNGTDLVKAIIKTATPAFEQAASSSVEALCEVLGPPKTGNGYKGGDCCEDAEIYKKAAIAGWVIVASAAVVGIGHVACRAHNAKSGKYTTDGKKRSAPYKVGVIKTKGGFEEEIPLALATELTDKKAVSVDV